MKVGRVEDNGLKSLYTCKMGTVMCFIRNSNLVRHVL